MSKSIYIVYETTNLVNNKKYIGCSSRDDSKYLGSGRLIKQAIKKYGRDKFIRKTLKVCSSHKEMCEEEYKQTKKYNAVESKRYYNLAEGGSVGVKEYLENYWSQMTPEERKKSRNWSRTHTKPYYQSDEEKKISSNRTKEYWQSMTPEERKKSRNWNKPDQNGSKNPMYGRSAIKEQNLKWYTNGKEVIYVTEDTQPKGFVRGRKIK